MHGTIERRRIAALEVRTAAPIDHQRVAREDPASARAFDQIGMVILGVTGCVDGANL